MSFARPELLVLAAALPALVLLLIAGYAARRRRAAGELGDAALLGRLGAPGLLGFPARRALLLGGAAMLLGIAAAGPSWGVREVETRTDALNMVLVLDVSRSMLVEDVAPSRLETMRIFLRRLTRELQGDRIGIVVFAGRAYVLSPMTTDAGALNLYIDALDPELVSQGGSALSAGIAQGTDLVRARDDLAGDRVLLVVADGEALEEEAAVRQAADRARRAGVTVHTVGVGTLSGGLVPDHDPQTGEQIGYKRWQGEHVVSRLDEELLRDIARRSGGSYFHLPGVGAAGRIISELREMQRARALERRVERVERYAIFAFLALLLIVMDALLARRAAAPPGRRAAAPVAAPARAALLALLVAAVTGFGIGDVERGNRHYRDGRYAEAVEAYEAALRRGRTSPELHYNLGTALLALGRHADAEAHLQRALESVEPDLRQRTYYNLGNRFLEAARANEGDATRLLDAAAEAYRHALRLDPRDIDAKWNLELTEREREQQPPQPDPQRPDPMDSQDADDDDPRPGEAPLGDGAGGQGGAGGHEHGPAGDGELSREEAERILNAAEQDELQVTRERLRKGQRRTPVARDW
jgi:Ca-activated chloride channel homolog